VAYICQTDSAVLPHAVLRLAIDASWHTKPWALSLANK